ncbi:ribonucleotide reductase-associated flavodoxin, putative [Terribacillus aidingensis]|uniref:Ribonucleotide reductase-associated flavodoxin, putative n=1 Tax=Terribacillus aidingensis TaxID=586416 RepID=A0A285NQY4_9BACI|nr:flavodoxin [Terribacillus aidingensis]SNZ10031.1 ribonucleotide reductase-associated flavodoxin, putative [Terribacillus aidingensis]
MRPFIYLVYSSISGNTKDVAQIIKGKMASLFDVIEYRISDFEVPPTIEQNDVLIIGSYTWGSGETPAEVKDFVAELGIKPDTVFAFGTGDTQFGGDEMFCMAADKLTKFYNSPLKSLKVEQSPRGSQEREIEE